MTRDQIMKDPTVHKLTKQVLELTEGKDLLDRYYDVKLALQVLRGELGIDKTIKCVFLFR